MRPEQWQVFKKAAKGEPVEGVPVSLIVDSPWIPGYAGISHLDYYLDPEAWFQANLKLAQDFPDVILFPSWWVEYGMATEPSALGGRVHFWPDRTPDESATLQRLEDVAEIKQPDCHADGLMPFVLHLYQMHKSRIFDAGYTIPAVAARGPLCLAAFLRDVNTLMMDFFDDPDGAHALLRLTTQTVIDWLKAQAEVIGDSVEGILVLDDIVGFLSPDTYEEFAHPYLKQICDAFPDDWVKVYHNDANVRPVLEGVSKTGFDVLNWSHKIDIAEAMEKTGGRMRLMGNVPPLDIGVRGTPDQVRESAREVIAKCEGRGLILSVGGGTSPGMSAENIRALVEAAQGA